MKTFLLIMLAGCAVRCEVKNYYVVEIPEDRLRTKPFKVYWNVPTMQCASKKIPFENLYEKFGIIQNENDRFKGDKVVILYDPGLFPALFKNESSGKYRFRNGGVPQEGNLDRHLLKFKEDLDESVPDANFNGVGIIDFESWRPVFRQNFGTLQPYKDVSYEIERNLHPWWSEAAIVSESRSRFTKSARKFMEATLVMARKLRPRAIWGFYGFPYCFNMVSNNMAEHCARRVPEENDEIPWMWSQSSALYPSLYSFSTLSPSQLAAMIRGRVKESARFKKNNIIPYFWFRYRDAGFFSEKDLNTAISTLYHSDASGILIWGASSDVNTVSKCTKLRTYVENTLGPAIAKYTKNRKYGENDFFNINDDVTTDINDLSIDEKFNITHIIETIDPEFQWVSPENYTKDVNKNVENDYISNLNDTRKPVQDGVIYFLLNSSRDGLNDKKEYIDATSDSNESTTEITNEDAIGSKVWTTESTVDITNTMNESNLTETSSQWTTDTNMDEINEWNVIVSSADWTTESYATITNVDASFDISKSMKALTTESTNQNTNKDVTEYNLTELSPDWTTETTITNENTATNWASESNIVKFISEIANIDKISNEFNLAESITEWATETPTEITNRPLSDGFYKSRNFNVTKPSIDNRAPERDIDYYDSLDTITFTESTTLTNEENTSENVHDGLLQLDNIREEQYQLDIVTTETTYPTLYYVDENNDKSDETFTTEPNTEFKVSEYDNIADNETANFDLDVETAESFESRNFSKTHKVSNDIPINHKSTHKDSEFDKDNKNRVNLRPKLKSKYISRNKADDFNDSMSKLKEILNENTTEELLNANESNEDSNVTEETSLTEELKRFENVLDATEASTMMENTEMTYATTEQVDL